MYLTHNWELNRYYYPFGSVDLGVMVMKGYFTLSRTLASTSDAVQCRTQDISVGGVTPLWEMKSMLRRQAMFLFCLFLFFLLLCFAGLVDVYEGYLSHEKYVFFSDFSIRIKPRLYVLELFLVFQIFERKYMNVIVYTCECGLCARFEQSK